MKHAKKHKDKKSAKSSKKSKKEKKHKSKDKEKKKREKRLEKALKCTQTPPTVTATKCPQLGDEDYCGPSIGMNTHTLAPSDCDFCSETIDKYEHLNSSYTNQVIFFLFSPFYRFDEPSQMPGNQS